MKSSGKAVASGSGTAPKVRSHKRKAYVEPEDEESDTESATVPSFHPPVQSSTSNLKSNTAKTNPVKALSNTLTAHWATTSKISAQRQAEIDYYLLRFVICCSIAFAILDNRFFIDFLAHL